MPRPYCPGPLSQCGNSKLIKMKNLHAFETAVAYGEEYYCCNKCGSKYNVNDSSLPSMSATVANAIVTPTDTTTTIGPLVGKQTGIWTKLATAGSPLSVKKKQKVSSSIERATPRYFFPPAHEYPQTVLPVSPPIPLLLEYTPTTLTSPDLDVLESEEEPSEPFVLPDPEPEREPGPEPEAKPPEPEKTEQVAPAPQEEVAVALSPASPAFDILTDDELIKLAKIDEIKRLDEEEKQQAKLDDLTRLEEEARLARLQRIAASPYVKSPLLLTSATPAAHTPPAPRSLAASVAAMSPSSSPIVEGNNGGGTVVRSYASQISARLEEALVRSPFQPRCARRSRSALHSPSTSSASRTPFSPTRQSPSSSSSPPPIGPDVDDALLEAASASRLFGDAPGTATPFVKSPRYEQLELELEALMKEKEREALAHRRAQTVLAARKAAVKEDLTTLRDERLQLEEQVKFLQGTHGVLSPSLSSKHSSWGADSNVVGDVARPVTRQSPVVSPTASPRNVTVQSPRVTIQSHVSSPRVDPIPRSCPPPPADVITPSHPPPTPRVTITPLTPRASESRERLEAMRAGRSWGRTGALFYKRAEALGIFGSPLFDS